MEEVILLETFAEVLYTGILILAILVVPGLIAGLMVAVFQAATQINEMSLSFIPKLFITLIVFALMSPWIYATAVERVQLLYKDIPYLIV